MPWASQTGDVFFPVRIVKKLVFFCLQCCVFVDLLICRFFWLLFSRFWGDILCDILCNNLCDILCDIFFWFIIKIKLWVRSQYNLVLYVQGHFMRHEIPIWFEFNMKSYFKLNHFMDWILFYLNFIWSFLFWERLQRLGPVAIHVQKQYAENNMQKTIKRYFSWSAVTIDAS